MSRLSADKWAEVQQLVPVLCVDVLPWAVTADGPCILLISRVAEQGDPRWALVGGRVNLDETLQDAASRHLRTTLGDQITWSPPAVAHPATVGEYLRTRRTG